MKTLKSAILTLLILIGLLCSYMVFKFDSNYLLKLTALAYERQDYSKAKKYLLTLKKRPSSKAYLYEGYVSRADKQIDLSNAAFLKAFEETELLDIKQEASFNLLVNAYQKHDFEFIRKHLSAEKELGQHQHFFQALLSYESQDYSSAYQAFLASESREYYSKWMEKEWKKTFPKEFEVSRIARCLIEIGKPHQGRLLLEENINKFKDNQDQVSFLIGYSYLKESENKPFKSSISYFQKAHPFLLSLILSKKESFPSREEIAIYYRNLIEKGLSNTHYTEINEALNLIDDLRLFDLQTVHLLINQLEEEKEQIMTGEFLTLLKTLEPFASKFDLLREPFSNFCQLTLHELIQDQDIEALNWVGKSLEKASQLSEEELSELITLIEKQILSSFFLEEENFGTAYALFLYWDRLEREDTQRERFLNKLTYGVKKLWQIDAQKALEIAKVVDQFSHIEQKPRLKQAMLEMLQEVCADLDTPESQEAYFYFNPMMMR